MYPGSERITIKCFYPPFSPYIIGTMSQATSSAPNLQLHHNFRYADILHPLLRSSCMSDTLKDLQPSSSQWINLGEKSSYDCMFSDQVGAVCQPHGAGERLPWSLPEEEADRSGDRQPNAQRGAGEDNRLDPAGLAPPQPLPGDAQLLRRHHR